MVEFRHGRVVIDLPDDWADQSTLAFVAPVAGDALPTSATVTPPTEAVQINFFGRPAGGARAVLRGQAEALELEDPQFEVVSEGEFRCGLGSGWHYVQRMTADGFTVRQLVVAIDLGDAILFASAVASDERFDGQAARLRGIIESVRAVEAER